MRSEIDDLIRKHALMNAIRHGGRSEVQPVLGRILADRKELRSRVDEIAKQVHKIVEEVNLMSLSEQRETVEESWPSLLEERRVKKTEKGLLPLSNANKFNQIVTRFSPNPDGALHLGSSRAIILSHDYAEKYDGKFLLRFEDTDPKGKPPILELYAAIREDLSWLGCDPDEEIIQSDRLPIYYDLAKKILALGHAYVCECSPADFRIRILENKPCPCRDGTTEQNLKRWGKMFTKDYAEGAAVVRIKTDLNHPNPAVRDWPAIRIIDTERYPHPRTGDRYRVWPLYNFACGIDDHLLEITHIIRGKEHLTNEVRQRYLYNHLGWEYPVAIHYGRLKIVGSVLSKSKILAGVRDGTYEGWDDPRLATLSALRRRGITAEAIRKMIYEVGPNPIDATLSWKTLYSHNRKIIDGIADRYFFVSNPIEMTVSGIPGNFSAKLPLHPDHEERGHRILKVVPEHGVYSFHLSSSDLKHLVEGKTVRLIGLFNVQVNRSNEDVDASFISESYEEARRSGTQLIHWIPGETGVGTNVLMPDNSVTTGLSENSVHRLKPDQIVQFERFGFVRVDSIGETLSARFAHS